jgi:hypothetical protein
MQIITMKAGVADRTVVMYAFDNTTGLPRTDIVFNSAGIDLKYWKVGANAVSNITEVTQTVNAAHSDGGFVTIGNGYYRLDLPDDATSSGTGALVFGTVTGATFVGVYINLVAYDPADTVRLGLTALPNAAVEAVGGLFTRGTGAGQVNQTVNGLVNANLINIGGAAVSTTTAQLGVNAVQVNGVATSSVTTINANLGTAQPVNHTGTGASATVKADTTQIAGATVSTSTAQIGANIVQVIGDPVTASSNKTTNWGGTP